jgi:ribonuclease HI
VLFFEMEFKRVQIREKMGSTDTEMLAIAQALHIVQERATRRALDTSAQASVVFIYSDSQAALVAIRYFAPGGKHDRGPVIRNVIAHARALNSLGIQVGLHWVPGYKRIPGNALADCVAKRAAKQQN